MQMHERYACVWICLVMFNRIWILMCLHCSWWRLQLGLRDDVKCFAAKLSQKFIITVFLFIFCSCWPSPPSSSQALATTLWGCGTWAQCSRSRSWKVTRTSWRQLRSTRAGSTWRQVRGEEHEQRRDMIARWTWWPSLQELQLEYECW